MLSDVALPAGSGGDIVIRHLKYLKQISQSQTTESFDRLLAEPLLQYRVCLYLFLEVFFSLSHTPSILTNCLSPHTGLFIEILY